MVNEIEIKITVEYKTATDRGNNDFRNLKDLKYWLDKHPELAEKLGYVKKQHPK
jgi:hypothetical protein